MINRKTGWTSKPNFKRDSDGLANVDDFFDSEPEIQEFSSGEAEGENVPQDMIPASRRHRMNREERRQERYRHRGRPRVPSEEMSQELYEEQDQNEHSAGFFEEDQVSGFLPTRPLARTPLAPKNISREPSYTGKSRSGVHEIDGYHDDNVRRDYAYDDDPIGAAGHYYEERDDDRFREERPVSRAYSVKRDYNPPRSPRVVNDGYLSDRSKYELARSPLQHQSRRGSQKYNRDGYQNSPRMQQGYHNHSLSLVSHPNDTYGGEIQSPRTSRSHLQYPESSTVYEEGQSYSSKISRLKYPDSSTVYEEERYPKSGIPINRRKSYYAEERAEYEANHYPGSGRKLRKSLSYPELPRARPLSRAELADHAIVSRTHSRLSTRSPRRVLSQSPLPAHHDYDDHEYDDYGTPINHQISEPSYEHEIARSLSKGKNRISSARSQKVSVEDVHQRFEGEDYKDFPAPIEDRIDYNYQIETEPILPIEGEHNLPKSSAKVKRGRPRKKKMEKKFEELKERTERTERREKQPVKRTLYPGDFKTDDQENEGEGVRKSKRVKIPPLAYWKNEKIVYGRRDSGYCPVPVMKEVIRIESDSDRKSFKRRSEAKKETLTVEKTDLPVINYVTQKEEDQQIVVTPDMIDPRTVGAGDYRFQKVFSEGEFLASGVLYLPRGSQKPNKNSNSSAMIFVVMAGQVQVQIHKTIFTVGTGAQFFVPRGNQYRISNSGYKEARLFFCHGKEVNASSD